MDLSESQFRSKLTASELPICVDRLKCRLAQELGYVDGHPRGCMVTVDAFYSKGLGLNNFAARGPFSIPEDGQGLTESIQTATSKISRADEDVLRLCATEYRRSIPQKDCPRFSKYLEAQPK